MSCAAAAAGSLARMTAPRTATPAAPASTAVRAPGPVVSMPPRARTGTRAQVRSARRVRRVQGRAVAGFGASREDRRQGRVVLGGEPAQLRRVVAGAADQRRPVGGGYGPAAGRCTASPPSGSGPATISVPPASARIARSSAARAARSARGRSFSRSTTQRTPPATAARHDLGQRPPRQPPVGQHHDPGGSVNRAHGRLAASGRKLASQVGPSLVRGGGEGVEAAGDPAGAVRQPAGLRPRTAWRWPSRPGRRPG